MNAMPASGTWQQGDVLMLGEQELQAGWRCQGVPDNPGAVVKLAAKLVRFVDMTPDGEPEVHARHYPTPEGKGGEGLQVKVYQPLTESWCLIGTWPAHGFTRVNLSSCKPFDPAAVGEFLRRELGPVMVQWAYYL